MDMNKMIRLKKVLGLLMAGIVICAGITACGNDSKSVSNTEVTGETENSSSEEVTEDTSLSIPGMWQTASVGGYGDEDSMQPDYYVLFTDSEIQYGHMKDGEFSLDHSDKISSFEITASGGYKVQAKNSEGFKYTYQTCEDDETIMEYYGSWDENEFAETYSGSASLLSCESLNTTEQTAFSKVSVDYLDDVKDQYPDYEDAAKVMGVNTSDYETVILFYTDEDVEDFRVFSLDNNIDENGIPDYIATEVFKTSELKKDAPVAVPLNFPGDMSLNGFCYKGADGNLQTFTVGISGEDGSLVINAENFAIPEQ